MNFLKKGPELKLSGLKVPAFLVALVAVPIALSSSGSESEEEAPPPTPSNGVASGTGFDQTGHLVATSAPGLRDYRRRLKHLTAKDPFKQQYSGEEEAAA